MQETKVANMLYNELEPAHEQLSECLKTLREALPSAHEDATRRLVRIARLLSEAQAELTELTRESRMLAAGSR